MWFVSSDVYRRAQNKILELELRVESLQRLLDEVDDDRNRWRVIAERSADQVKGLFETLVTLKRDGFNPPPTNAPPPPQHEFPSVVEDMISRRAGDDPVLMTKLMRLAASRLESGATPEDVAAEIKKGSNINPFLL